MRFIFLLFFCLISFFVYNTFFSISYIYGYEHERTPSVESEVEKEIETLLNQLEREKSPENSISIVERLFGFLRNLDRSLDKNLMTVLLVNGLGKGERHNQFFFIRLFSESFSENDRFLSFRFQLLKKLREFLEVEDHLNKVHVVGIVEVLTSQLSKERSMNIQEEILGILMVLLSHSRSLEDFVLEEIFESLNQFFKNDREGLMSASYILDQLLGRLQEPLLIMREKQLIDKESIMSFLNQLFEGQLSEYLEEAVKEEVAKALNENFDNRFSEVIKSWFVTISSSRFIQSMKSMLFVALEEKGEKKDGIFRLLNQMVESGVDAYIVFELILSSLSSVEKVEYFLKRGADTLESYIFNSFERKEITKVEKEKLLEIISKDRNGTFRKLLLESMYKKNDETLLRGFSLYWQVLKNNFESHSEETRLLIIKTMLLFREDMSETLYEVEKYARESMEDVRYLTFERLLDFLNKPENRNLVKKAQNLIEEERKRGREGGVASCRFVI